MPEIESVHNSRRMLSPKIGAAVLAGSLIAGEVIGWIVGIEPVSLEQFGADCALMGVSLCTADLLPLGRGMNQK